MRTGTDLFKEAIQGKLNELASKDSLFAETLKKENKNIDDCISHIYRQVQDSGRKGFTDDEVYAMAVHYYDEDDIKVAKGNAPSKVIVNHVPELSDEEKEELKERARKEVIEEERLRIVQKRTKPVKEASKKTEQPSLF